LPKERECEEAARYFSFAVRAEPGNAKAWLDKAIALGLLGKHSEAGRCYAKALELGFRKEERYP